VISDVEVVSPSLYRGTVETTGARGLPLIISFCFSLLFFTSHQKASPSNASVFKPHVQG
jgi:hypothetical protein